MPFSLSLYLYSSYQKKFEKAFDQDHKVLTQPDIEFLATQEERLRTLRIFRSAVKDHSPVEGVSYHLIHPVSALLYHDGFKKALIADAIALQGLVRSPEELSEALLVLDELADPERSPGYVQILAWNALGHLARENPSVFKERFDSLLGAFEGSVASLTGALVFANALIDTPARMQVLELINKGCRTVRYCVQKALMNYYLLRSPHFADPLAGNAFLPSDIIQFLERIQGWNVFTDADYIQGSKEIGLIGWNYDPAFWKGTPHAYIGRRVDAAAGEYVRAAGAFSRSIGR